MSKIFEGIVHFTGEHDTGKTTAALEAGAPASKIAFFDDDIKGRATVDQIRKLLKEQGQDFGAYYDLVALRMGKTDIQYFEAVKKLFEGIEPGKFDSIVLDTWSYFAKTCATYVATYPNKFRTKHGWSFKGSIKGSQQYQEAQLLEAGFLNMLATKAKQVIVITHLRDYYLNGARVPGKMTSDNSRTINRVPRLRIWLRQNRNGPVPVGLVLKRVDEKRLREDGSIRTTCILPRKIVPLPEHESIWDTIANYYDNPVGNRPLEVHELPNKEELSILDGTVMGDQYNLLIEMVKQGLVELDGEIPPEKQQKIDKDVDLEMKAKELAFAGKSVDEIASELDAPLVLVRKWVKAS